MKWFGRLIGNGVLCGLSLVVALCIGELMVRYLAPQKMYRFPQGMFENHPTLQFRLTPHFEGVSKTIEFKTHIRVNAHGLRADREYGRKGPKTFRVLALGDSFTMGVGVEHEDTYGQVLERQLADGDPSQAYEVINAGVPGYNTQQALTYLRQSGFALEPDLIVLGFYIGNDIHDNFNVPAISVQDGFLQEGTPQQGFLPRPLRRYVARTSHLYQLLWPYQRRLFNRSEWANQQQPLAQQLSIYAASPAGQDTEALWGATRRQVEALADLARREGVPLLVVVIPEPLQVDAQRWQAAMRPVASNGVVYRADWPNRRIVNLCRELNLSVLDLLPELAPALSGEPLYIELDGHWTRRGNAVAAMAIHAYLRRQRLIPVSG